MRRALLLSVAGLLAATSAWLPARASAGRSAQQTYIGGGPALQLESCGVQYSNPEIPQFGTACFKVDGDHSVNVTVADAVDSNLWVTWKFHHSSEFEIPVELARGAACGPMLNEIAVPEGATDLTIVLDVSRDGGPLRDCGSRAATTGTITATFS